MRNENLVFNYYGVSGIGKSSLLNHLGKHISIGNIISGYTDVHIDCKQIGGDLLEFMKAITRNIGEKALPSYVSKRNEYYYKTVGTDPLPQHWANNLWDLFFLNLRTLSSNESLIIFIDSFEKIQETILGDKIRKAVNYHYGDISDIQLKIVIGSQEPIGITQQWIRLENMEVELFSGAELREFAEKNLGTGDSSVIAYLIDEWKGNPLELGQLIGSYRKDQSASPAEHLSQLRHRRLQCILAADRVFMERLGKRLGPEDTDALSRCAVPKWFNAPVLRAMTDLDVARSQSQVKRLSQIWFVKARACGIGYEIHERYRGPILRTLIQDDNEIFSLWNECCYTHLQSNKPRDGESHDISRDMDSLYHLMAFNEEEALRQYNLLRYRLGQIKRLDLMTRLQDEAEGYLRIDPNISTVFRRWIQYGRAIVHYWSHNDDLALKEYEQILEDPALDVFLKARVLRAKGDLLYQDKVERRQAKTCYDRAIRLFESLLGENVKSPGHTRDDTLKSLAEVYMAVARIEEIKGNILEETNHYRSAIDLYLQCDKNSLGPSYGRALEWMGRSLRLQGDWEEAHRYFDEAEEFFNNLLKKATSGDTRAGWLVEEINDRLHGVRHTKTALWIEEGRWNEAKEVSRQVVAFNKSKPEEVRNQETLGVALLGLGDVLRMEGDLAGARQAYLEAQENLQRGGRNKGYPLLGLAEVAVIEGDEEDALKYLSEAEEKFSTQDYQRKLGDVAICRARLSRKLDIDEALATLEKAWERISKTTCTYTKSAVLVELSELAHESDRDSNRCGHYREQARALAGKDQGFFAEHLARLCFLEGRIAGEKGIIYALMPFTEALVWAARHNTATLQKTRLQAKAWLDDRLDPSFGLVPGNVEELNQGVEAMIRHSEEMALSVLPEEARLAFKGAVAELERSIEDYVRSK